jgi:RNA polymerase sigma factor (sigma-70 family)
MFEPGRPRAGRAADSVTVPLAHDKEARMDPLAGLFDRWHRQGDLQALGAVFDALAPRLLPVAMHLCGHAADAEDALQQTFLLAMDRGAAFDADRRLEPWLAGLLQNVVRNQKRHAGRRRAAPLPECASEEAGPMAAAERAELVARLRTQIDALPAEQRQVLRLQLQHGMSPTAIAEVLEVPPGAVRMRLHRGLEALRRLLPAGLAALLGASLPARGLTAVKQAVLTAAAAQQVAAGVVGSGAVGSGAAGSGSMAVVGGALAMKKLAALLVLVCVAGMLWWSGGMPPMGPPREAPSPAAPPPAVATMAPGPAVTAGEAAQRVEVATVAAIGDAAREPAPTELWGLVVDGTTQQPIAGAAIELLHRDADEFWNLDVEYGQRTTVLARATSDRDGRFRFEVVRARPHRLAVQAGGYAPVTLHGRTGGSEVTVALARGATVSGLVRCEGKPVAAANVSISVRGKSVELANGRTDADGAFRFPDLPPAQVHVKVGSADFAEKWTQLDIAPAQEHRLELELQPGRALRGRVVDAVTGAGIADARVADSWTMKRAARTDADGRFVLAGLRDGAYAACHVQAAGFATASRNVGLKLDDEVEFRLLRGGEVTGRIVDAGGAPLPGVYAAVCASFEEAQGIQGSDWIPARIAADGRFLVVGLRTDQHYWLMVRAPGCGGRVHALPRVLGSGERIDVGEVVLRAGGGIEGRVRDEAGAPLANREVSVTGINADSLVWLEPAAATDGTVPSAGGLRRKQGHAGPTDVTQFRTRSATTDGKGRFRFRGLAAGSYTVSVRTPGSGRAVEAEVPLRDGELRDEVELVVANGMTIAGVVVSASGKQFPEPLLLDATIEDDGRHERHAAHAGADGSFRFEGVVDGLYTIALVSPPPGEVMPPVRHVRAGSTGLRLQLEVPSFVAGRVVDAAGKPVRAHVHAIPDDVRRGFGGQLSDVDGRFRLEVPVGFRGRVEALVPSQQPEQPMVQGEQRDIAAGRSDLQITVETRPFLRR